MTVAKNSGGGDRRQHVQRGAVHASTRVCHAPASEIYSRARAGRKEMGLVAEGSDEAGEQGGVVHLSVELSEVD